MNDDSTPVSDLRNLVRAFVSERNWESFHEPKNLAMSLAIEAAEVLEHFQWLTAEQSLAVKHDPQKKQEVGEELSDVLAYLLSLANVMDIDLSSAFQQKMLKNAIKYPAP
jgi:dCTP diphosphatase